MLNFSPPSSQDYIPVRFIGIYQAMLGISWGLGYIVGALLGPTSTLVISDKLANMDGVGILTWSTGVVCLVLALSWGGTTYAWSSSVVIALLCVSVVLFGFFGLWERTWASDPIVPRQIFANRSTILILLSAFLYGGCFQSLMTYLPLYLSVIRKEDSMATNLELLCLVLVACICNVLTGVVIVKSGRYTWATRTSLVILTLACGLLNLLRKESSRGLIVGLMIITGVGSGGMINSEIITAQASVPVKHVPAIVAFMTFCDQVGGITGITIQGSILSNYLSSTLQTLALPGVSAEMVRQSSDYVWNLPAPTRSIVLDVYMDAVRMSFWGSTAFAAAGLLAALGLKAYVMRTKIHESETVAITAP
ncbi:hypothetical protein DFQ30_003502 [Apophysomyces sp. BC1015]|nr:hypothetical protein DFQ30_003502 [Apophysomyces sp. BC1015]